MLGLTSVTFRQKSVDQVIDLAKNARLDCIEWGGDIHVKPCDLQQAKITKEKTLAAGLQVCSYGSYLRIGKSSQEEMTNVLQCANTLGADTVRIWCGTKSSADTSQEEMKDIAKSIADLCDEAKKYKIKIASEFHNNTLNDSAESAKKVFEIVNRDNYATYWQPTKFDDSDMKTLTELKKHIANVHVFAWNKNGKRYPLDKQFDLWKEYIDLLKDVNVNYIMEFVKWNSIHFFKKDASTLLSLLGDKSN